LLDVVTALEADANDIGQILQAVGIEHVELVFGQVDMFFFVGSDGSGAYYSSPSPSSFPS